jgi:hypothetical protein
LITQLSQGTLSFGAMLNSRWRTPCCASGLLNLAEVRLLGTAGDIAGAHDASTHLLAADPSRLSSAEGRPHGAAFRVSLPLAKT